MKKQDRRTNAFLGILAFTKFLAFTLPLVVYLSLILLVFPARNSGFITLGVLGSIIIGLGLVNLVGLIDKMYLGHILTVILMVVGSLLVLVSSVVVYTPAIYNELNEKHVSFYFVVWSLLIASGIYYPFYRQAIALGLRDEGLSKTNIRNKMKNGKNFWWYHGLKDDLPYQWIYWVNKLFTIMFPCVCIIQLLFGWLRCFFWLILLSLLVLLALNLAMSFLIITTWNSSSSSKKHKPSIALMGIVVFPVGAAIGLVTYFCRYI